jgi:hypothetical protein
MLDPDPLDCLVDTFSGFDAASSYQDVTNRDSQSSEANPQKRITPEQGAPMFELYSPVVADSSHPEVPPTSANAAENATAVQVFAPKVSATTNEPRINAMLTPIEADVALLNLASDGKDVRSLDPSRKPFLPLSSIYSSKLGSGSRTVPTSSSPHPATSHRITDPYPTTEGLWGFARRRLQRQAPKTGSTTEVVTRPTDMAGPASKNVHRKDVGGIELNMDFNAITSNKSTQQGSGMVQSPSPPKSPLRHPQTPGESNIAEGNGDDSRPSSKNARPVSTPRMVQSPSSSKSPPVQPRASSQLSSTSSRGKAYRKSQTVCVLQHADPTMALIAATTAFESEYGQFSITKFIKSTWRSKSQ